MGPIFKSFVSIADKTKMQAKLLNMVLLQKQENNHVSFSILNLNSGYKIVVSKQVFISTIKPKNKSSGEGWLFDI